MSQKSFFGNALDKGQQYVNSLMARAQEQDGSTPHGGTPTQTARGQSQETEDGPTLMEMFGTGAPGMRAGSFQPTYTATPFNKFGLGPDDRSPFGGGMQMGGNPMTGFHGGGGLVWGGGIGGGGGGEAAAAGMGNNYVGTPMPGGRPTALAGGMATNQGWIGMGGGGGGDNMYGGNTPAQRGQIASPGQHHPQFQQDGTRVYGDLFPQTPQGGQLGGISGAPAATNAPTGTAHGPAQSPTVGVGGFPYIQAMGNRVNNHDPALVEEERGLQTDDDKDEKAEVLASKILLQFLYMPDNSHVPRIVISPTLCPEDRVPPHSAMGGQTIVFTARNNVPFKAPTFAFWQSKEVSVPAGTDAVNQRDEDGTFKWSETSSGTKKTLRRAFLFPSSLAEVGAEWSDKNLDVLQCYEDLCTKFPGEDQYADLKDWLLGASQGTAGDGSGLRLKLQMADHDEPTFGKWCEEVLQLRKVIPVVTTQPPQLPPQAPTHAAATAAPAPTAGTTAPLPPGVDPTTAFLVQAQRDNTQWLMSEMQRQQQTNNTYQTMLLNQMQHSVMGGGGGPSSTLSTSGTSANRSDDTWAGILSLSHKKQLIELSWWWNHVLHSKKGDIKQKKADLKLWLQKWALREGLPIHKAFDPDDDVVWAWITGDFRSSTDYSRDGQKGLSPYSGMPVTTEEVERRQNQRNAEDASAHTRTLEEAVRIEAKKGALPSPPGDWDTLLKTIVVFTGIVALLFGEANDLYEQLREIIDIMMDEEVERNKLSYLGVKSRQIFWLILVETKRYCNMAHSLWQFQQNKAFPTCNLRQYKHYIKNASEIAVIGFPQAWNQAAPQVQPLPAAPTGREMHPPFGQWGGFHPLPGQLPPYMPPPQAPAPAPPAPVPAPVPSGGPPKQSNTQLRPARVTQACLEVYKQFPGARILHFVVAAGKTMSDLPKIRGKITCYNYLMGKCKGCNFEHYELANLNPAEYEEWVKIMEQGASKILENKALPELARRKRKSPSK